MWQKIKERLSEFPAQQQVALTMIKHGIRVGEDGSLYCGNIELSSAKFARAIGVDRRAVTATSKTMLSLPELKTIFTSIKPTADMSGIAKTLGYGVLEIKADARAVGLLAKITAIIASKDMSIRQLLTDDPDLVPEPRAVIITDRPVPGETVNELLAIPGIKEVTVK